MVEEVTQQSEEAVRACAVPDCTKPALMQCPTCLKLELEATYFCDQDCFKAFWKFHKLCHQKKENSARKY